MGSRWTFPLIVLALVSLFWWLRDARPELDPPAVVAKVRQLQQLATVRYTVQKVVGIRETKGVVGEESILLIVQAHVDAGIDLASLRPEDVSRRADGALVVRLPPAKVFGVAVDEKETKVWDRQKTWWTPWVPYSLDLEQRARTQGVEAARQAALDGGILKQAERNAVTSIQGLLTLAGAGEVVVLPAGAS